MTFWTLHCCTTSIMLIPTVQPQEAEAVPVHFGHQELAVEEGVLSHSQQHRQHQTSTLHPLVPSHQSTNHHHLSPIFSDHHPALNNSSHSSSQLSGLVVPSKNTYLTSYLHDTYKIPTRTICLQSFASFIRLQSSASISISEPATDKTITHPEHYLLQLLTFFQHCGNILQQKKPC